jgi:Fe-S-cluster-containing dehydrogenase component/DMSO reductase anchor subunit
MSAPAGLEVRHSPISAYLERQQRLETPVAQFSREHRDLKQLGVETSSRLVPLSLPKAGQQLAFEVNLDACTGCKACVAACHSMNGLEEAETWRDVGMIFGASADGRSYQQTITSACHHCADPECLNGCPVLAYEKDPVTGIVRHLDDQCIGCQYCVLKCPYDVPKYSENLGIVRKCDMCAQRLNEGEAPACVAACPTEAIRISIVDTPNRTHPPADFLQAAPDPCISLPTTRFVSSREIPANAEAGDADRPRAEHAHYPLVFMLTLTQFGLGAWFAGWITESREALVLGAVLFLGGLATSPLHLGRPLGAWRAFLGLRRSWLSREIVLFGAFAPLFPAALLQSFGVLPETLPMVGAAAVAGLVGAFSSAMIYIDTHRRNWRARLTLPEFAGTLLLGFCGVGTVASQALLFGIGGAAVCVMLLLFHTARLRISPSRPSTPSSLRAKLLRGEFRHWNHARLGTLLFAGVCFGSAPFTPVAGFLAAALVLVSELIGRKLYFQTVIAPRMPGGLAR